MVEDKKEMGKKSRAAGKRFELKVRKDLEEKGWIVDKWTNNVEFKKLTTLPDEPIKGELIPAKSKFRGKGIPMMMSSGFPDFIIFGKTMVDECEVAPIYWDLKIADKEFPPEGIFGVESKMNGKLDKTEKEKCRWLLENNIFSKILVAKKKKVGRKVEVEYVEFKK